jgi:hypothetical protein
MDLKKVFDAILYFIILPVTSISFILTPLTNDSRIFIGAAAIADRFYPLPYGLDAAYEVKPIGNRIINWVLYKIGNTVVPFVTNDYTHFGYVVKAAVLIFLVLCCWYVARRIKFPYAFPLLFMALACEANFGLMMSEWFAVILSLVAVAFCFEENKNWVIVAGALCLYIALLKSITALMVIPILCAIILLGGSIDWKRFVGGYLTAGFAFLALCLTVWPFSIGDMLMSRLIAHVGMYDLTTLLSWFWFTQGRSNLPTVLAYYVPALLVGFVAAIFLISFYYFKRDKFPLLVFIGMWVIPIGIVFAQSEFIIYHYIVMVLPAIVSIALFSRNSKFGIKFVCAAILFMLTSYIIVNSAFGTFSTYEYSFWHQKEQNADNVNAVYNLTNQTSILYLDPGDSPFYFHANSSCHYITPMPVERSTDRWNMTYLPQFKETFDCIVNYQGEYIVADVRGGMVTGYYGEGILIRKEITDMIEKNYTKVDNHSWEIYKKKDLE